MKTYLIRAGIVIALSLALWCAASLVTGDTPCQGQGCPCCGCPPGFTQGCCECSVHPAVAHCCCTTPTPPPQPTSTPGGPPTPVPTPTPIPPCVPPVIVEMCYSDACPPPEQMPVRIRADCEGNILASIPLGGCGDLFCAIPTPPPQGDLGPCDPLTIGLGNGMFNCGGEFDLTATAYVGNSSVTYKPYPKGMVTIPNTMELHQDEVGAIGWSSYAMTWPSNVDPPEHDDPNPFQSIKDFRFGLRWRKDPGLIPTWYFGDGDSASGWTVIHTYDRSSYGQSCTLYGMEAYCLTTMTYWLLDGVTEWEQWEQISVEWSECFCRDEEPLGIPHRSCSGSDPGCVGCTTWCGKIGTPYYDWVHHEMWEWIDLREIGWPTEYYAYVGPSGSLPVIEAQSVIDQP